MYSIRGNRFIYSFCSQVYREMLWQKQLRANNFRSCRYASIRIKVDIRFLKHTCAYPFDNYNKNKFLRSSNFTSFIIICIANSRSARISSIPETGKTSRLLGFFCRDALHTRVVSGSSRLFSIKSSLVEKNRLIDTITRFIRLLWSTFNERRNRDIRWSRRKNLA